MLTFKLVHLIQYHSDKLAESLLRQVQMSDLAKSYCNVPPTELKQKVHEIYQHLGTWLLDKSESDIAQRYRAIGGRRTEQNVPLSELVWVIVLTKRTLLEFVDDSAFPGRAVEVSEKLELFKLIDQFFDLAIHAAVVGHELAAPRTTLPVAADARIQRGARKVS
jgi:hypothetical protein